MQPIDFIMNATIKLHEKLKFSSIFILFCLSEINLYLTH